MPKSLTMEQAFNKCESDGKLIPQKDIDKDRITSLIKIADEDLKTINELKTKNDRWNTLYKLSYDVLHGLTEAYLISDKIKSLNHQCLFAYLCTKHPQLEFDWNFFEKIRTKRNGIHYYGSSVAKDDWKEIELQIFLYIKTIKTQIERKLIK